MGAHAGGAPWIRQDLADNAQKHDDGHILTVYDLRSKTERLTWQRGLLDKMSKTKCLNVLEFIKYLSLIDNLNGNILDPLGLDILLGTASYLVNLQV